MRSIEQVHPAPSSAPAAGRPGVVVLADWRATHARPAAARRLPGIWLAILTALAVFGPHALASVVRHRATSGAAPPAAHELALGD